MGKQAERRRKAILGRYGIVVTALLLVMGSAIIFSAGKIVFTVEGKRWREVGEKETIIRDRIILPKRGSIYTHDGKLLATSEPLYGIFVDFWAGGMNGDTLKAYAGDLSIALAKKFPDRSASQYKKILLDGWELRQKEERMRNDYLERGVDKKVPLRSRYVRIIRKDIYYIL